MLDWFIEISIGIRSDGLPIWWWDLGIHRSDRVLHMRMVTNIFEVVIGWVDSCINTLHISVRNTECFTSSRKAQERFAWRGFMDNVGGDMRKCTTCK